jgi:type 1 fimbria pilin
MNKRVAFLPLIAAILLAGCKADDPEPDENELITTVMLRFTSGGTTRTFSAKDLDGDGGVAPVLDKITLAPNVTYDLAVEFKDESKSPVVDITSEVSEEADEHLVIYTPNPSGLMTVTVTDKDSKNLPIGLRGTARTQATAGTGKLTVQLRHQPGTKNGTPGPGSDDANVTFDVEIN